MEKEFTQYTEALALKELGFEEPCLGCYVEGSKNMMFTYRPKNNNDLAYVRTWRNSDKDDVWSAPLYQQAFKWFREKYKMCHWVYQSNDESYFYSILKQGRYLVTNSSEYKTYEEAELECLKKLIGSVKK